MPVKKITDFISATFKKQGFTKGIIAISGGIDSAVSLTLAVKALGVKNIYTLQLPYKRQPLELSNLIISQLNIPLNQRLIIKLNREADKLAVKLNVKKNPLRFGNILARLRMICLYDQAKKLSALVIGTENKSEKRLGYYTRYGDEAADINPIAHLYKTEVIALAKELKLSDEIINQPPSANLWPGQTDETELGFTYAEADKAFSGPKLAHPQVLKRLKQVEFKSKVPYSLAK
ncbi:MAG: NAD(+) synthase [Candidatus Beckwithbacteria bacterium]